MAKSLTGNYIVAAKRLPLYSVSKSMLASKAWAWWLALIRNDIKDSGDGLTPYGFIEAGARYPIKVKEVRTYDGVDFAIITLADGNSVVIPFSASDIERVLTEGEYKDELKKDVNPTHESSTIEKFGEGLKGMITTLVITLAILFIAYKLIEKKL